MKAIENFDEYLKQLELLFKNAEKQKNKALWLYQNNLRTPMFMLEALSKMYANFHNKKKFTKHKERYKRIEDLIGACDYYDAFIKEFELNKKIPKGVIVFMKSKFNDCITTLNETIELDGWLAKNYRTNKIRKKLSTIKWLSAEDEINAIGNYFFNEIQEIDEKLETHEFNFSDVEIHLHEFRRNIRWLSIYAQALQGKIQLTKSKVLEKGVQKYLTKEVLNSPYNKMPDARDNKHFLMLEQSYFYALSWMINELGKLKDEGLRVIALRDALMVVEKLNEAEASKKSCKILGCKQSVLTDILANAEQLTSVFKKEKNLNKLLKNIVTIS